MSSVNVFAGFLKIKVCKIPDDQPKRISPAKIELVLEELDCKRLPYREEIAEQNENKDYKARENVIRIVTRREKSSYETIKKVGAIPPNIFRTLNNAFPDYKRSQPDNDKYYEPGNLTLNVKEHRGERSEVGGFISCTIDINKTKLSKFKSSMVYLIKAKGAVPPSSSDPYPNEEEYSIPGGCDEADIIGARELNKKAKEKEYFSFCCNPIFIRKSFLASYPGFLPELLDMYLESDEDYQITEELKPYLELTPPKEIQNFKAEPKAMAVSKFFLQKPCVSQASIIDQGPFVASIGRMGEAL